MSKRQLSTPPAPTYDSLFSDIYTPTGVLKVVRHTLTQPWRVELALHIPQYIDNRSLLKIELLQTNHNNVYLPVYKEMHTITPDNGSGPRSIGGVRGLAMGRGSYRPEKRGRSPLKALAS